VKHVSHGPVTSTERGEPPSPTEGAIICCARLPQTLNRREAFFSWAESSKIATAVVLSNSIFVSFDGAAPQYYGQGHEPDGQ
jgi:predicted membrane-bound mannosyltransferase